MKGLKFTLLLLAFAILNACQSTMPEKQTAKTSADSPLVFPLKQSIGLNGLAKDLQNKQIVAVGEMHDRFDHHQLQLSVLKIMAQQGKPLALGVEWFQRPFQSVLDAYIAGELSESEMLEQTEYYSRWRFDFRLYQDILRYAKAQQIPVIALNASKELTKQISKRGMAGLNEHFTALLPKPVDRSNKAYEKRLRMVFSQHSNGKRSFDHFMDVQLTWDETMAQMAANYLDQNKDSRMLVLAGNGHIVNGYGIPDRLTRRTGLPVTTITANTEQIVSVASADYLVFTEAKYVKQSGKLGVFLDLDGRKLHVDGISKNSKAGDAGVKKDDRIIEVNGNRVNTLTELKLQLQNFKPGDQVEVGILRGKSNKKWLFKVTLT